MSSLRRDLPSREVLLHYFEYREGKLINRIFRPRNKAGTEAGTLKNGYLSVELDRQQMRVHRVIWKMETGEEPNVIDHINGDKMDNRMENLRNVTHQINSGNRHTPTLYPVGVAKNGNRYTARLQTGYKCRSLGTFDTPEQARQVYLEAIYDLERRTRQ